MSTEAASIARELVPRIAAARVETEAERKLPESVVSALVESQLFRLAVPEDAGGLELDPLTALDVYETLGAAEASAAWLVWNSSLPCLFSRFLSADVRGEIFSDASGKYASSTRPTGKAVVENGAYRVSGRWSLVSGCMHADWLGFMCLVEEDGELRMMGPGPELRMVMVPAESCEIVDTWHVGGLRGTGSHDVVLDALPVAAERTFSPMDPPSLDRPIGRMPIAATMSAGHAAICLGIASGALDALVALGRTKVTVDPVPHLPDRAANQFLVARTRTKLGALRAELHASVGTLWEAALAGETGTLDDIGACWSAAVTTGRECRALVTDLYEVAGSPSLYVDSPLERAHRDVHAAMQHVIAQRFWVEEAGRIMFGMEPTNPLFAL